MKLRYLVLDIFRALMMIVVFVVMFLAFTTLTFILIEIALGSFLSIAHSVILDSDMSGVVVCLLSLGNGIILTALCFLKLPVLMPQFHLQSAPARMEVDDANG